MKKRPELHQVVIVELFIRRYNCTFVFFKDEILNFFRMQYFYKRFDSSLFSSPLFTAMTFTYGDSESSMAIESSIGFKPASIA